MVASYLFRAVILMIISDIRYSTGLCLCSGQLFRYSTDCCREPILEDRTTQKPLWDVWWTRRPPWYASTTTQMPLWKRLATWESFGNPSTTMKQTTRPTTLPPFINFERTTRLNFWDIWTTRKLITERTLPYLRSTTPSSSPEDVATIIGASVGGVTGLGLLSCVIAACVRIKRVQQRRLHGREAQPRSQCHTGNTATLSFVIHRTIVRRFQFSDDAENLISSPRENSGIHQTPSYNWEPISPAAPPPYSPAPPSVPPPPYSEYI